MAQELYKTKTYYAWSSMKTRCYNKKSSKYHRYGGRGITVCASWHDYKNFLEDMGEKPNGTSLDRIDNNGNYEPDNCRWATATEQSDNRSVSKIITIDGVGNTLRRWAIKYGLKPSTVSQRIYVYGWNIERALTTPPRKRG